MYKGASRSLQKRHAVDRPHPSRGYIDDGSDALDVLPDPTSMSADALRAELGQLRSELIQIDQLLTVAKAQKNSEAASALGYRRVTHCTRLSVVKLALAAADGPSELQRLGRAINDTVSREIAEQIFARSREMRGEGDIRKS